MTIYVPFSLPILNDKYSKRYVVVIWKRNAQLSNGINKPWPTKGKQLAGWCQKFENSNI